LYKFETYGSRNPMEIIKPKIVANRLFSLAGIAILAANYVRHNIFGYRTPRPFSVSEVEKVFNYEAAIVRGWQSALTDYVKSENVFEGRTILELGPGSDLGTGLLLLALGAKRYIAFDAFGIAKRTPISFYDKYFRIMLTSYPDADISLLREEAINSLGTESGRLRYVVDRDFLVSAIGEKADIILSNASFEHFDDGK